MKKIIYSSSPHIRSTNNTKRIMLDVCIALLPACVMAVVYFGLKALFLLLIAILSSIVSELVYRLLDGQKMSRILSDFDFTSLVTGMLIGLNMPPFAVGSYWYVPMLASIFAIIVVKMLFGGTGRNLVNPAIAGRVFVFISFIKIMTGSYVAPSITALGGDFSLLTGATPLTELLTNPSGAGSVLNMGLTNLDLLLGTGVYGCIGETCKVALIVGGLYLCIRGVINFRLPLTYIAVVGLMTVALKGFDFNYFLPSILSGGLILGAIFMATDYVTTPNTSLGNYIYFVLLGLVTAGLRLACKMEVVSFAIMLMNLIVPLIDKYIVNKPFGATGEAKK